MGALSALLFAALMVIASLGRALVPHVVMIARPTTVSVVDVVSLASGIGTASLMGGHVQEMCNAVRQDAQSQLQASGWNGIFSRFEAVSVSEQQRSALGTKYVVKVSIGSGQFVYLCIFTALSHEN